MRPSDSTLFAETVEHFPRPTCTKCMRPVERVRVLQQSGLLRGHVYIAECHGNREMRAIGEDVLVATWRENTAERAIMAIVSRPAFWEDARQVAWPLGRNPLRRGRPRRVVRARLLP